MSLGHMEWKLRPVGDFESTCMVALYLVSRRYVAISKVVYLIITRNMHSSEYSASCNLPW